MAASEGAVVEVVKTQSETGKAPASAKHKKRTKRRTLQKITNEQNGEPGPSNPSESETAESLIPPISTAKDKEEATQSPKIESSDAPSPELNYSVDAVIARFEAIAEQAPPKNPKPIEPKIESPTPQETKKSDLLSSFKMIVSKAEKEKQKEIAEAEKERLLEEKKRLEQQQLEHDRWENDFATWTKEEELAELFRSKLKREITQILWDALVVYAKDFTSNSGAQKAVERLVRAYYVTTAKLAGKLPKEIKKPTEGEIENGFGLLKRADFKEALNIFSQHESDKNFKSFCAMLLYTDTLLSGGQFTGWARQDWFLSKSFFSNDFLEGRDPPNREKRKQDALDIIEMALCNDRVKRKCIEVILGDNDKSILDVLSIKQKDIFSEGITTSLSVVVFPKADSHLLKQINPLAGKVKIAEKKSTLTEKELTDLKLRAEKELSLNASKLLHLTEEEFIKLKLRAAKELKLTKKELKELTDHIVSLFSAMLPPSKDNGEDEKDEEKKEKDVIPSPVPVIPGKHLEKGDGLTDTNPPTDTSDDPSLLSLALSRTPSSSDLSSRSSGPLTDSDGSVTPRPESTNGKTDEKSEEKKEGSATPERDPKPNPTTPLLAPIPAVNGSVPPNLEPIDNPAATNEKKRLVDDLLSSPKRLMQKIRSEGKSLFGEKTPRITRSPLQLEETNENDPALKSILYPYNQQGNKSPTRISNFFKEISPAKEKNHRDEKASTSSSHSTAAIQSSTISQKSGVPYTTVRTYLLAKVYSSEIDEWEGGEPSDSQKTAQAALKFYENRSNIEPNSLAPDLSCLPEDFPADYTESGHRKIIIHEDRVKKEISFESVSSNNQVIVNYLENDAGTTDIKISGKYEQALQATVSNAEKLCLLGGSNIFVFDLNLSESPEDEENRTEVEARYCSALLAENIVPIFSRYEHGTAEIKADPQTAVWKTYNDLCKAENSAAERYLAVIFEQKDKSLKEELIRAFFDEHTLGGTVILVDFQPRSVEYLLADENAEKAQKIIRAKTAKSNSTSHAKFFRASSTPTDLDSDANTPPISAPPFNPESPHT